MWYRVQLAAFDVEDDETVQSPEDAAKWLANLLQSIPTADLARMVYEVDDMEDDQQYIVDLAEVE